MKYFDAEQMEKIIKIINEQTKGIEWKVYFYIILIQCIILILYIIYNVIKRDKICIYNILITYLLVLNMVLIIQITISGREYVIKEINLKPLISLIKGNHISERTLIFYILNIALFVPYGVILRLYKFKILNLRNIVFICFCSSLSIEIIQFITNRGVFEIDDIIFNTLGGWLGANMVNKIIKRKINKKRE